MYGKILGMMFKLMKLCFQTGGQVCPTLVSVWSNRAAAYLMTGEVAKCIADCNTVINLEPTYTKAYVRKAKALVEQDKFHAAVEVLTAGRDAIGGAAVFDNRKLEEINYELSKTTTIVSDFDSAKKLINAGHHSDGRALLTRLLRETNANSVVLWTVLVCSALPTCTASCSPPNACPALLSARSLSRLHLADGPATLPPHI